MGPSVGPPDAAALLEPIGIVSEEATTPDYSSMMGGAAGGGCSSVFDLFDRLDRVESDSAQA